MSLNRIEAGFHELELLKVDIQVPSISNVIAEPLAPALCRTATRTDKKELGIDVGDALAYVFTDTIAVTPPLFRIIIRVGG